MSEKGRIDIGIRVEPKGLCFYRSCHGPAQQASILQ